MNDPKRRFFSGDTLKQALIQAANHYHLAPEEIAYRNIEKRHGFLKTRRKVVIEVDPEAPRRDPAAPRPADPAPPALDAPPVRPAAPPPAPQAGKAAKAEEIEEAEEDIQPPIAAEARPPRPERSERPERFDRERPRPEPGNRAPRAPQDRGDDRGNRVEPRRDFGPDDRGNRISRGDRGDRSGPGGDRRQGDRPFRGDRAGLGERGNFRERREGGDRGDRFARGPREGYTRTQPSADRLTRVEPDTFDLRPVTSDGLIPLPEMPRRPSERYPEATGPVAAAAARGMELLLSIAGLDLTPRILQGEERLEVDLSGEDVDWCFADDGEFVVSVEHLLPRVIRSLSGEAPLVRVDCDNFQEIREERLRSLAQRVADDVRRKGRPRTLEPMNPADRRIVHMTLADDPGVVSESSGDGYFKRVTIRPA